MYEYFIIDENAAPDRQLCEFEFYTLYGLRESGAVKAIKISVENPAQLRLTKVKTGMFKSASMRTLSEYGTEPWIKNCTYWGRAPETVNPLPLKDWDGALKAEGYRLMPKFGPRYGYMTETETGYAEKQLENNVSEMKKLKARLMAHPEDAPQIEQLSIKQLKIFAYLCIDEKKYD